MKKFFTLAAISLMAIGAYAQDNEGTKTKSESWQVYDDVDGVVTLKSDYVANSVESEMSVVEFSTNKVNGTHTSGPISGYTPAPYYPIDPDYDNTWGGIQNKVLSADGSVPTFYYVSGKGNPVNIDRMEWKEETKDEVWTGNYTAVWDDAYYSPDGTNGLPTNGTYVTLTPSVDGTFKVGVYINKDNREVYVVKASTMKALTPNTEVAASGFVEGINWGDDDVAEDDPKYGYPMDQQSIEISDAYIVGEGTAKSYVYLTFAGEADETYYIFNKSTQIGFSGFEFEYEDDGTGDTDSITEVVVKEDNPNAPIYNLAGQRVTKNAKGILIQNGKKFIAK